MLRRRQCVAPIRYKRGNNNKLNKTEKEKKNGENPKHD